MNSLLRMEMRQLMKEFPQILLTEQKYKEGLDYWTTMYLQNLMPQFSNIENEIDDSSVKGISGITVLFMDDWITFDIEILCQKYDGKYTAWCPQIYGCVTDGNTKMNALNNLVLAIVEINMINYHHFENQTFNDYYSPLPEIGNISFDRSIIGNPVNSKYVEKLIGMGFNQFYEGKKHVIIKSIEKPLYNFTLLYGGITDLTKFCQENFISMK